MSSQKYTHTLLIFFGILGILTTSNMYAAGVVDVGGSGNIKTIVNFSSGDLLYTALSGLYRVIDFVRLLLNGVALLAMLYVGFLWVTSMGNEEKQSDGKNRIMLVVLGLFLINIPEALYRIITGSDYRTVGFGRKINDVSGQISTGTASSNITDRGTETCNFFFCPQNFWGTSVDSIIPILEVIMLIVAVVMFTIGGFRMLLGGSESASESAKKRLIYGVIALIITGFIEMIYRAIFFQSNLNVITNKVTTVIVQGARFFIYLAGPIAIIYIIIGGYYFLTSGGDEERVDKGKKILLYTFFATVMLLLGYTFLIEIVGLTLF